jgi:hypothetical protein
VTTRTTNRLHKNAFRVTNFNQKKSFAQQTSRIAKVIRKTTKLP